MPLTRRHRPQSIHRATPRTVRPPEPIPPTNSTSAEGLAALLGITLDARRTSVSESSVTGLPAVQAAVDMIAHAVAAMMADADAFTANGDQVDTPAVVTRPAVLYGGYEFWTQVVDTVMKRGNYVAIKADFDSQGYPRQVVPVHPDAVSMDDSTGIPFYTIADQVYGWDEVVHVRHGAPVGSLWGAGVVERHRYALERMLTEAEYGRSSFASGAVPSAVVTLDKGTVTPEEAEAVQERWIERHGSGARKPAVMGKGVSVAPLSWTPHDAEFVETRRLSVAEAAMICGLDPADLGASIGGAALTYANLTDRQLSRILQSFMPWMRLCEQAWTDLLPEGQFVRGNVEALLRSSTTERFGVYEIGHRLGVYTTDELRELERRPTLPTTPETETDPDA